MFQKLDLQDRPVLLYEVETWKVEKIIKIQKLFLNSFPKHFWTNMQTKRIMKKEFSGNLESCTMNSIS